MEALGQRRSHDLSRIHPAHEYLTRKVVRLMCAIELRLSSYEGPEACVRVL